MADGRYFKYVEHVYNTATNGAALPAGEYRVGTTLGPPATVYAPGTSAQISDVSGDNQFTYQDEGVDYDGVFKASNGKNFIGTYQHPVGAGDTGDTGNTYLYSSTYYKPNTYITGFRRTPRSRSALPQGR